MLIQQAEADHSTLAPPMKTKRLGVRLGHDQIEQFSKAKPLQAIEELLWNAFDADATCIHIHVQKDAGGLGIVGLRIVDDGAGIPHESLKVAFGTIGDSMKRKIKKTPGGRSPRGRFGRGRFKAFSLTLTPQWITRYRTDEGVREYAIFGDKTNAVPFAVGEPSLADAHSSLGTEVIMYPINKEVAELCDVDHVVRELSKRLALGLLEHKLDVRFSGKSINPKQWIVRKDEVAFKFADADDHLQTASMSIVEWSDVAVRTVYLCDDEGIAQHEWVRFDSVAGRKFSYTAYVKSALVERCLSNGEVEADELSVNLRNLKTATRAALDDHFRTRLAQSAEGLVEKWRKEGIYPYPKGHSNPIERVSREVFDICAHTVHDFLPSFEESPKSNRQLLFKLMKQAVETDSGELCEILQQVLSLTPQQIAELSEVLKKTRLGSMINAAKTVIDRLTFLDSTQELFFGKKSRDVNEPHQLQQILLRELWLFGDEYEYGCQEAYLRKALRFHAAATGREFDPSTGSICNIVDGKRSRLDLLLNRTFRRSSPDSFEHLVIELKRSNVKLTSKELLQVESYAATVANDKRFANDQTRWTWFLVGVECDDFVESKRRSSDRPMGLVVNQPNSQVWVRKWSELIADAKLRYHFFLERFDADLDDDAGLRYLHKRHNDLLPKSMLPADDKARRPKKASRSTKHPKTRKG